MSEPIVTVDGHTLEGHCPKCSPDEGKNFLREVERRAGASVGVIRLELAAGQDKDLIARWLRRIVGEGEPHQSGEQCRTGTCAICDEHKKERS